MAAAQNRMLNDIIGVRGPNNTVSCLRRQAAYFFLIQVKMMFTAEMIPHTAEMVLQIIS